MKTLTCDRCGATACHKKGIVGSEFENMGFETLAPAYRWGSVVDVCGTCFKDIQAAGQSAQDEAAASVRLRFLSRLGIGM